MPDLNSGLAESIAEVSLVVKDELVAVQQCPPDVL